MLRCCKCGRMFDECDVNITDEYRGEYWGFPAYETIYSSPCCRSDFEDVEDPENDEEKE